MTMYKHSEIEVLHLEVTDKCNASCPQCARNDSGGAVNPLLTITELRLSDIEKMFSDGLARRLRQVILCGGYGDAVMARDTIDICEFFRKENPDVLIGMHTNGSARSVDWWREMARVLQPGYMCFGVDGLADTNHIYRRGTRFELIMRNAQAYIDAGGYAIWDYILFAHNEHQVREADELSKKMGFKLFQIKETPRFFDKKNTVMIKDFQVKDSEGKIISKISPPKFTQSSLPHVSIEDLRRKTGGYKGYLTTTPIKCQVAEIKSMYITADGYALPCCYLGSHVHRQGANVDNDNFLAKVEALGGFDAIDAKKRPLREIVDGPLFQVAVPESWKEGPERNPTCARICGSEPRLVRG